MIHKKILHFEEDASGRWFYVPEPDEKELESSKLFLFDLELALRMREPAEVTIESLTYMPDQERFLQLLPEWLKDTIYAISVLAELLTTRFMKDGQWVKISKWNIGWNFISLIMVIRITKDIVKAFKRPSKW